MTVASPVRPANRLAFLLRPWWIGVIVTALLFTAACWLILAPWQFRRHHERDAQNSAVAAAVTAVTQPVGAALSVTRPPVSTDIWRPVTATGTFLDADQVYARLRQYPDDTPAAEVVLPFRLTDGTLLLVDRGFMHDSQVQAGRPPAPVPTGQVTITGRVQDDQPDPTHRAPVVKGGLTQVYGVDSAGLLDGAAHLQGFIQLTQDSPGALDPIGLPQADDGPFLSYAWQWCGFGAMALLALGYFLYREATDPVGVDPDEDFDDNQLPLIGDDPPGGSATIDEQPVAAGPRVGTGRRGRRDGHFDRSELYD